VNRCIRITCFGFLLFLMISLLGCMVGPNYERPITPADQGGVFYYAGKHIQDINQLDDSLKWWRNFGDDVTGDLVLKALENNYDLKAAAARVLQAQEALRISAGVRLPQIDAAFDRSFSRTNAAAPGATVIPGFIEGVDKSRTYTGQFNVSYVLDLFGKLKRSERASMADYLASDATQQALTNTVIASVIKARINIATFQRTLAIARANTKSRRQTLQIVERRYGQGLVGPVDVRLARENLASSQATEPALELFLIQAQHALDVLVGSRPGSGEPLPETLADLPDLDEIPVGLPASLLDRRPDIRASELALVASSERIGVSISQLYPDLTLTGAYGWRSYKSNEIFVDEASVYSYVLRAAQPLFRGGVLKAQVRSARARYSELAADYAGKILVALQEVENSLVAEEKLQSQYSYTEYRLAEALAAENLSRERYQRGVEGILTVLESERRRRIAENELAILKGNLWANRVDLFLALGGDWRLKNQATTQDMEE